MKKAVAIIENSLTTDIGLATVMTISFSLLGYLSRGFAVDLQAYLFPVI